LEEVEFIVDLQLKEIRERLGEHGVEVELSPAAREWLARAGYDPAFGARPLRRALQKFVESPLSVSMLSGQFTIGDSILVDVNETKENLVFNRKVKTSQPAEVIV
jgi:ATP-dependent Clp protease ATP-binding subunit ClpC